VTAIAGAAMAAATEVGAVTMVDAAMTATGVTADIKN
jgi:hypothetical protein